MKFFARHNIDKFIYEEIYNKSPHKNGTFIEIGALDGIKGSNTLFFEKHFDWFGILIEPQIEYYNELIKNRRNKNYFFNYAISKKEGKIEFIGTDGGGGLIHTMSKGRKNKNHKNKVSYKVKSIPFKKIITHKDFPIIDFFSLDVEGGEYEVLETFDWNIKVNIISIELQGWDKKRDEKCRELLRNKDFKLFKSLKADDIWVNKNI